MPKPFKLRCPDCGSILTPPVSYCPECQVDLRLAYLKKKRPQRSLLGKLSFGLQVGLLVAAAIWLVKHAPWSDAGGQAPGAAPASQAGLAQRPGLTDEARREAIAAAPAGFQKLAEEHPLLLLPYIYVYRAKTAVERLQEQSQARHRQIEKFSDWPQDIVTFKKSAPGQRRQMLEELFEETK